MRIRGAGELNDRVTLQYPSQSQDSTGYEVTTWVDVFTMWAAVVAVNGGESIRGLQVAAGIDTIVIVRFGVEKQSGYSWAQHRLLLADRTLNIVRASDDEGEQRFLTLYCKEVDAPS